MLSLRATAAQLLSASSADRTALVQAKPHFETVHYYLFDYLRLVLAVGVLAAHANSSGILPGYTGDLCVKVFFALSGFLIGGILLRTSARDLPRFYFNRVTRIWIPYAIAVALLLLGTLVRRQPIGARTLEFFFYKATFVYNIFGTPQLGRFTDLMPLKGTGNHFWSICVEEQFYLVAPLLIIFCRRARVPILIAVWLVGGIFTNSAVNFGPIALGVLLAISKDTFGPWYLRPPAAIACLTVCAASGIGLILGRPSYDASATVFAASLIAVLARSGAPLPFGEYAGGLSYSLYLNHWIGLSLRNPIQHWFALESTAATLCSIAIAIGLALAHYTVVDRSILHNRARWYTRRSGVICCALAYALLIAGLVGGLLILLGRAH